MPRRTRRHELSAVLSKMKLRYFAFLDAGHLSQGPVAEVTSLCCWGGDVRFTCPLACPTPFMENGLKAKLNTGHCVAARPAGRARRCAQMTKKSCALLSVKPWRWMASPPGADRSRGSPSRHQGRWMARTPRGHEVRAGSAPPSGAWAVPVGATWWRSESELHLATWTQPWTSWA